MLKHKAIFVLSLCLAGIALALGFIAFKYAGKEAEYREQETRKALREQTRLIAEQCLNVLQNEQQSLFRELRGINPGTGEQRESVSLLKLRSSNPLIRDVFITDSQGNPVYPDRNNSFFKRYANLFLELSKSNEFRQISSTVGPGQRMNGKSPRKVFSSWNNKIDIYLQTAETNTAPDLTAQQQQPLPQIDQQIASSKELSNLFFRLTRGASSGWIPWFSDNRFCPLIWARCEKDQSRIAGGEIETVALISRIITVFPQELPDYFRFELTDAQGNLIYSVGGESHSDTVPTKIESDVSEEIAPLQMPNFRIRGYLSPAFKEGSRNLALANLIQIVSLILILIAGGMMLFWLMRRELIMAARKSSFVANVSHELKTPLTSIRMYAELLDSKKELDQTKRQKYLKIILSESERLSRLITNVLDFSKIEEGRKKYNPENINLSRLLLEIAETHRPSLQENNMALKLDLPSTEVNACIDRDSLVQVLQNLISNAVKYAAAGKELTLALSKEGNSLAVIKVQDRGPGIPSSQQQKVFRKFYRCDNSLTAATSGSGLGLAIARSLMREQNGDLTCSSRPDGGAEFRIVLTRL